MKVLLENGADINARAGYYQTALIAACDSGHEQIVKLLLEKGAETDVRGDEIGSAVEVAAKACYKVKTLIDKGAYIVHITAINGREDIVELLVAKGAVIEEHESSEYE